MAKRTRTSGRRAFTIQGITGETTPLLVENDGDEPCTFDSTISAIRKSNDGDESSTLHSITPANDEEVPPTLDGITPANDEEVPPTLDGIIPAIRKSNAWRILVNGVNNCYTQEQDNHHWSVLCGIIGEQVSEDNRILPNFICRKKNGVIVTIQFGDNAECEVTAEDVDLLVFFLPINGNLLDRKFAQKVSEITTKRNAMIWKHSIIILTGVDRTVESGNLKRGEAPLYLKTNLEQWTQGIQQALNDNNVSETEVPIIPAGRREQPDLPKPYEKWFLHLWHGCFTSSKVDSIPAILKLAQGRIRNDVKNTEIVERDFYKQYIRANENSVDIPRKIKVGFGLGGSAAIIGGAAIGATTGGLIGGLALGIPTLGIAAEAGAVVGAVVGAGVGITIAGAAVGAASKGLKAKNTRQQQTEVTAPVEIEESELKQYYQALITHLPMICTNLTNWARKQSCCRVVVIGVEGEGVSTVCAALVGKTPSEGHGKIHLHQTGSKTTNFVVYDFPGFPKVKNKHPKARELVSFQNSKKTHLTIFCIPMTTRESPSLYIECLKCLCERDEKFLSNTVIALTHANQMRAKKRGENVQTSFPQFFNEQLIKWKNQIKEKLPTETHIEKAVAEKVPVIPVGNVNPSIDLSDNEQPSPTTQYHWLSELLLHAMPVIKLEGLPTLIKINRERIDKQPNEYQNQDRARELIADAQISMFSSIGNKQNQHPGEAIGLIFGENDTPEW